MEEKPQGIRLQKALSEAGISSRRATEQLIVDGRVKVNGKTARLGQKVVPTQDRVEVDGRKLHLDAHKRYFVLNKPVGVLTTSDDPKGRTTVLDLLGEEPGVFAVGRLDMNTEGILLLTNDGDLANRLTHPSFGVQKTYLAEVEGVAGRPALSKLTKGISIGEPRPAVADKVEIKARRPGARPRTLLEITLHEGRNHVVRRMLEAADLPVVRLTRIQFGPIPLGRLASGGYRRLNPTEVASLYRSVDL